MLPSGFCRNCGADGMNARLPPHSELNIGALSKSLSDTTNSYKFLWFLGLLECLPKTPEKSSPIIISQRIIFREMIKTIDRCLRHYRLNFGASDKMRNHIEYLARVANFGDTRSILDAADESHEVNAAFNKICYDLSRFVPQQWLTPFVRDTEKMPVRSDAVAVKIRETAAILAESGNPPPYRFASNRRGADIVVHREWHGYFIRNYPIVRGWALFKWINFLQSRNPNTPGIITKIAQPEKRAQLTKEREWWRAMIGRMDGFECIYSGARITESDDFALDHYVPWSFVGHNCIWNLIPAAERANIKKSDRLPSMEKYFDRFIKLQQKALAAYNNCAAKKRGWKDIVDSYAGDLRVDINSPPSAQELSEAYYKVIPPLIALAKSQGFPSDWDYEAARM